MTGSFMQHEFGICCAMAADVVWVFHYTFKRSIDNCFKKKCAQLVYVLKEIC